MINFKRGNNKFNYRISGILIQNGKLLLHKMTTNHRWMLPGGRAEFLEDSKETLVREFKEELNCKVEVKNLKFVVENFFEYNNLDYHELEFIHVVELKKGTIPSEHFIVKEFGVDFEFQWFSFEEMKNVITKPDCLSQSLDDLLKKDIQHYIYKKE